MIKWIGQHIWDFVSRFRNDVYLESLSTTTESNVLVVDSDGKVSKSTSVGGDITSITAGTNCSGGGASGDVTINVDDAFLINSGDDATTGTITAGGFTTTGTWTFDEYSSGTVGITTVQDSGTTFNDNDTSLMTAAAIDDRILSYGYSTTTGTVTSVGTNTGLSGTVTSSGNLSLALGDLADMTQSWVTAEDEFIVLDNGTQKRKLSSEIFGSNAFTSTTIGTTTNALTFDDTTIQLNTGTTFDGSAARTVSAKTAAVSNDGTALATGDQIYDFVTGLGYVTSNTMGSGFTVSATTDSNATTITQGDDLFFAAGTGITCETTADGTVTITNTVSDTNTMGSGFTVSATTDSNATTITQGDDLFFAAGTGITCETTADGTVTITNTVTDTNTQLSDEQVQDIVGGMFSGNTETLCTVTYQDSDGTIDLVVDNDLSNYDNSSSGFITATLTTEQVQDIAGPLVATGGTKTLISVTYDDANNNMDFVVDNDLSNYDNSSSGFVTSDTNTQNSYAISCVDGDNSDEEKIRLTQSGAGGAATDDIVLEAGTGLSIARSSDKITFTNTVSDTNTQLTDEQVQDIVGGMFSGNTETRISATYQDSDGTIDLVVDDMTNAVTSIVAGDGIDVSGSTGDVTVTAEDASTTNPGIVELATTAETTTGTSTTLAVTPDGLTDGYQGSANVDTVGTLTSGSISSAFGDIDNGASGVISTGTLEADQIKHEVSGSSAGDIGHGAEVVYFGSGTVAAGRIYYYKSDGSWELTNANAEATSSGLLGVALDGGTASSVGMCIRGMVCLYTDSTGDVGDVLWLATSSNGIAADAAPTGGGDIARVIGYCLNADGKRIFFNPDNTFVEIA